MKFRLFSIGVKISILTSLLVMLTIGVLAWVSGRIAKQEIVDHEIIDLGDDTNLVATEILSDISLLRTDAYRLRAQISGGNNDDPRPNLADVFQGLTGKGNDALLTLNKRYLRIDYYPAGAEVPGASIRQPGFESVEPPAAAQKEFLKRVRKVGRRAQLSDFQVMKVRMRIGDQLVSGTRCGLQVGLIVQSPANGRKQAPGQQKKPPGDQKKPPGEQKKPDSKLPEMIVITMSCAGLSELRYSPRHLVFLIEHGTNGHTGDKGKGTFILHPKDESSAGRPKMVHDDSEALSQGLKKLADRQKDVANATDDIAEQRSRRGYTAPTTTDLDGYHYLFMSSKPFELPEGQTPESLNKKLIPLRDDFPGCGFSVTNDSPPVVYLRAWDSKQLSKLKQAVGDAIGVQLKDKTGEVDASKFLLHFTRIPFDVDNPDRSVDLVVAVSEEELKSGIEADMRGIGWWALALALGGVLVAFLFSGIITRPLKKITRTTDRFAKGDMNIVLPTHDKGEIGDLARSFEHMVHEVRRRSEALQEREAQTSSIVNTAAEGIVTFHADGQIESLNVAARRIFGYRDADGDLPKFDELVVLQQKLPEFLSGVRIMNDSDSQLSPVVSTEAKGRKQNGDEFPLELSVSQVPLSERLLYTAIVRDITERKRTEAEIQQLNEHLQELNRDLDRRVRERTEELVQARDAANQANQAKSDFLAKMSHELRTPLTAIIGYSEMLQEECEDDGQEGYLPDLQKITSAGKHLLQLINDILDLSKIEAGRMELELTEFDPRPMLEEAIVTIRPVIADKKNSLEVQCEDDLGTIRSDITRLKQCLLNLLSNAAKFTENGAITLAADRQSENGRDWVLFSVSDTGIGMSPDQLDKLFKPFSQADVSTTRKFGGTGLGLAITQHFSEMMGGDVSVESELDVGTTFTIRIPADGPAQTQSIVPPAARPAVEEAPRRISQPAKDKRLLPVTPTTPRTVMVVDDDEVVRDVLQRFLTKEGYEVVGVASGADAVAMARKCRPQAITLDVMMPEVDGWQVLKALKAEEDLADIPVIMLTIVEDKKLGFTLGADDYLTKPLDREHLLNVLNKYCNQQSPGVALVVEDDERSRELFRRTLEKDGWTVTEAQNGIVAMQSVAEQCPSLILLDLMMPDMDGFEFLDELRRRPGWQSIPVIVITAKELSEEDRKFLNGSLFLSGCVRHVFQKGKFDRQELLESVRQFVDRSHRPEVSDSKLEESPSG